MKHNLTLIYKIVHELAGAKSLSLFVDINNGTVSAVYLLHTRDFSPSRMCDVRESTSGCERAVTFMQYAQSESVFS